MIILKNPEQARAMGLISTKAQLTAGVADWPSFWGMIAQGVAAAGAILFALITSWVFGREFSDHTAKELMALPTPRWVIVGAKFLLTALWILVLTVLVFVVALGVGTAVGLPGGSSELEWTSFKTTVLVGLVATFLWWQRADQTR